jgi:AraC family transcriptional regulator
VQRFEQSSVFKTLAGDNTPIRAAADFGDGFSAVVWERNKRAHTVYRPPEHHTLSLYVRGGDGIKRNISGRQQLKSNGAGSLCLMPEGIETDWDVEGPVQLFHLYITPRLWERTVTQVLDVDPSSVTLRDLPFFKDDYLEMILRRALLSIDWSSTGDRLAATHAGQVILMELIKRFGDKNPQALLNKGGLSPFLKSRVMDFIEANLDQPLTIGDLAQQTQLSDYHFARNFKQVTGESPHAYVVRRRVEKAKELLQRKEESLSDIALSCGFSSQSHFSARFKKLVGVTPKQFQKCA